MPPLPGTRIPGSVQPHARHPTHRHTKRPFDFLFPKKAVARVSRRKAVGKIKPIHAHAACPYAVFSIAHKHAIGKLQAGNCTVRTVDDHAVARVRTEPDI